MHYTLGCDGRALRDNKRPHKRATTTTRMKKSKSTQNVHTPLRLLLVQCCVRWFHPFLSLSLSSSHLSGIFCSLLTADCCCISHYVVARAYEQLQYNAQNGKENRWKRFVSVADLLMPPLSTATPFGPSQTDFLVWWCNVLISSVVVDFGIHFVFTKKKIKISRLSAHIAWAFSPFHIGVDSFEMVQQCSCSETRIGSHARSRSISELIVGNTRSHHLSIPTSALMATYRSMTLLIYRQR